MNLNKRRERLFRETYRFHVYNFTEMLNNYCEDLINVMKDQGELRYFDREEHFKGFAREAMLHAAQYFATQQRDLNDTMKELKQILDDLNNNDEPD